MGCVLLVILLVIFGGKNQFDGIKSCDLKMSRAILHDHGDFSLSAMELSV